MCKSSVLQLYAVSQTVKVRDSSDAVLLTAWAVAFLSLGPEARGGEIHRALELRDVSSARAILAKDPTLLNARDESESTPLHIAARYGPVEGVNMLIGLGADVNVKSYNGFSPLHITKDGEIARALIRAGANLAQDDGAGKTPLQYAAQTKKNEVVEAILESGYPLDLASAVLLRRRELVKQMLKERPAVAKEVKVELDLHHNTTALGFAVAQGDKEIAELLLAAGAPVNAPTYLPRAGGNATALCNAVWAGHLEMVELLCEHGADCNVVGGKFYHSLLDYACNHSDPRIVEILLQHGAKPEPKSLAVLEARQRQPLYRAIVIIGGTTLLVTMLISFYFWARWRRKRRGFRKAYG
jgi:cytohesin